MQLNDLLQRSDLITAELPFPFGAINIVEIKADSRIVGPFDVFVSVPSPSAEAYIEDALEKGCRVIVAASEYLDLPIFQQFDAIVIPCENPRLALSALATVLYEGEPKHLFAVTGTNGKSSTTHFLKQLFTLKGIPCASLGTLGLDLGNTTTTRDHFAQETTGASLTTLDALRFHKLMSKFAANDIQHVVFEASSHGLDQYRLHGAHLTAAAFTNLSQDHLDYHQTMDDYFKAKAKLFSEILPVGKVAVLNIDDERFTLLKDVCTQRRQRVITYSRLKPADITLKNHHIDGASQVFDLLAFGVQYPHVKFDVSGDFQLENLMAALGLLSSIEQDLTPWIALIPKLSAPHGRLSCVAQKNDFLVYVDFAHSPDALEKVLKNLRRYTQKHLWVVFGCGGNRDSDKRPRMGAIASRCADKIVITDDNPRFEDPSAIRHDILKGIDENKLQDVVAIAGRRQAIEYAISHARAGDIIVVAGKGHERGQIVGNTVFDFDDTQEVLSLIEKIV